MITTAWLTTNRTCNNRCFFCYAQNAQLSNMDYSGAVQLIDELTSNSNDKISINRIILIGGEPALYSNFLELIKYIKEKSVSPAIATNGIMFSQKDFCQKAADAGLQNANISIKGVNKQDYYEIAGVDQIEKMIAGYHNLKEAGVQTTLSYVISEYNENKLVQLKELLHQNNMNNIIFQFVKPVITEDDNNFGKEFRPEISLHEMGKMVEYLYSLFENSSINYKIDISFPFCLISKEILKKLINKKKIRYGCHVRNGSGIVFDPDFHVLPCNHFTNYPFTEESIKKQAQIIKLWNSEVVNNFRSKANCYPSLKCQNCEWWNYCMGGCFTRWFYLYPDKEI